MKVHLLYRDRDLDRRHPPPWNASALTQDLALDMLLRAMARDDDFILEVCRATVLSAFENDADTISYRQKVLRDCLAQPAMARELYRLAVDVREAEDKLWFLSGRDKHPDAVLHRALNLMDIFHGSLAALKRIADAHLDHVRSDGLRALLGTCQRELGDDYLGEVARHCEQLRFPRGVLLSAQLAEGGRETAYMLHHMSLPRFGWELPAWVTRPFADVGDEFRFSIHPRDDAGLRALRDLRGHGATAVANVLGTAADHLEHFFEMLRVELAFYVGCLNLHERLTERGTPTSFPTPRPAERQLSFRGLYDVSLALGSDAPIVGNDADADGRDGIVITGPNSGGKSTLLRAVGLAQLMMQCGLFVGAESLAASTRDALFTHYRREEDARMESGKLDEELGRMNEIVDHVTSRSMILFNESFAATNEREGSEIARAIVSPLLERHVTVAFVTHHYEFAHGLYESNDGALLFLRAERDAAGGRTFKLREGEPLDTSFGADLYDRIFGTSSSAEPGTPCRGD